MENKELKKKHAQRIHLVFSKTSYFWEIIFAIILSIFSYKLIITKYLLGYWSKEYLLSTFLILFVVAFLMIYNLKNAKKRLERIFLTFIIPVGMFYMAFMLPTYAPDESAHIWRAYEISQGNLFAKQDENGAAIGVDVPTILIEAKQETLNNYTTLNQILNKKTNYEDTQHVISPAHAYSFVFYIPAAITFLLTRMFNLSIIYGIYIAKILNFIIFILGGYYAIKKIPFGKYIVLTCLFLPMVLQQAVSLSADSIINTGIFIYIAYTVSLIFQKDRLAKKQKIIYCLLILLVTIAKMAYIPLIGLGFLLIFNKNITKKEKNAILGLGTFICIVLLVVNYIYSNRLGVSIQNQYLIEQNVNGIQQIKFILQNPLYFLRVLVNTITINFSTYIEGCICSPLGWLNIPIKQPIITCFLFTLVFSIFIEDNEEEFSIKQRIWNLCIIIGTILLIITGLYIAWTGVGGQIALGVQGRYFIPILPIILLSCSIKHNYIKFDKIAYIWPIILVVLNSLVVIQLYHFFR